MTGEQLSLTEMLRRDLKMEPECDAGAQAIEDTLSIIKGTFKNWLRSVGLTDFGAPEAIRQLLVMLVDEP